MFCKGMALHAGSKTREPALGLLSAALSAAQIVSILGTPWGGCHSLLVFINISLITVTTHCSLTGFKGWAPGNVCFMCCMRTVRQLLLLLWRRDGGTERLSNLPQATQLEMVNPCLNRSCLTPEPQLVYKLRAWFLCHCDSLWSLPAWLGFPPCMGSPKAASPQLKRGQDRQGAQPESPSGWAATLGIRPHPHSWTYGSHRWGSEALGNRQERAPQQETLGARPAKP